MMGKRQQVWPGIRVIPASRKGEGGICPENFRKEIDEEKFWEIYNTIREIEASFRILIPDLEMRPVFHKTGGNNMAHLFLAMLAYQLVSTIR